MCQPVVNETNRFLQTNAMTCASYKHIVLYAYVQVTLCVVERENTVLGRVDGKNQKKIPHPKMEIFILDSAKVFLTTTNHDVFKSAFSAVCAICTRSELNALLHILLQERNSNDNGKYVIEPRLQR
jgi:hypothetical protein